MKVAIVCDWLVTFGGAERVISQILSLYPEADLFAIVDYLEPQVREEYFLNKHAKTSFIQKLPFSKKYYRHYLPLMPLAIEQFDLSQYDLVISSSHAVAKGVITAPHQFHISYVHTPMRYAWEMQHAYLANLGFIQRFFARFMLHRLRLWDYASSVRVDHFIANSHYVAARIQKTYRRDAEVIYPGVDVDAFQCCEQKQDYYVTASRLVPYKRIDLIVKAFTQMLDKKLIVIGDGPERKKIEKLATTPNIKIKGFLSQEEKQHYMEEATAFIYAAEEDFGIVPVEAQACGTPVIALGKGGVLETVVDIKAEQPTGIFFEEQTTESIIEAIKNFEQHQGRILSTNCRKNAERFSIQQFKTTFLSSSHKQFTEASL